MSVSVALRLALHSHCHVSYDLCKLINLYGYHQKSKHVGEMCGTSSDYYVTHSIRYKVCNERHILYPHFNSISYYSTDFDNK